MDRQRRWFPFWLWILGVLWIFGTVLGCTGVTPSAPLISAPFFIPTSEDTIRAATLSHELDSKALRCIELANCEQVYFERALVSLFENQEAARTSFHHVVDHNAASPLASSSQLWLRLIGDEEDGAKVIERSSPSIDLLAQFVRDRMERQVTEARNDDNASELGTIHNALAEQSRLLQAIQKQVRNRDRRIAILRSQLEALKLIDEEGQDKQRKIKPPASLRPAEYHLGQ